MTPAVIFEDEVLLILDKPPGCTVNRSDTTSGEETLQECVETYLHLTPWTKKVVDSYDTPSVFASRAGIVHRLDKETSGIIIVAKTIPAFEHLQAQFKNREVKKVYHALAHGKITPDSGEIRVPVGRLPWNRMRFGVVSEGKDAVTTYHVLHYYERAQKNSKIYYSFVALYPQTGRTHQIRVHLKYMNHPIVSDALYAGRKTARDDRVLLSRTFLHAAQLTLSHPTTEEQVTFESPLPKDLADFLALLHRIS